MQWHKLTKLENQETSLEWQGEQGTRSTSNPNPQLPIPNSQSPSATTQVILVRHGRSTFNEQGRFQGCSDQSVLTEAGRLAAQQVGAFLRNIPINAIYASPLRRVQQTIDAILEGLSTGAQTIQTIALDDRLREVDLPAWEGLPFQQVREQFAAEYQCWKQRPHEFQMTVRGTVFPFFPVCELYDRSQQFWQDQLAHHRGQTILIVGHGGSNHALISTALGLPPAQHHTLQQSNNGLSLLSIGDRLSSAHLHSLNLTQCLGETLPKLKEGKQGLRLLLVPSDLLFSTHIQQLLSFLANVSIDFSLSAHDDSQEVINRILKNHPKTVKLQVSRNDLPYVWQQSILRRDTEVNHLITGLVIAPDDMVKSFIAQAIGLGGDRLSALSLTPGSLSILHYPAADHRPILQAFNIVPNIYSIIPHPLTPTL